MLFNTLFNHPHFTTLILLALCWHADAIEIEYLTKEVYLVDYYRKDKRVHCERYNFDKHDEEG